MNKETTATLGQTKKQSFSIKKAFKNFIKFMERLANDCPNETKW